jgi:thioredoxin 2
MNMTGMQDLRLDSKGIILRCQCGQLNRALFSKLDQSIRCGKCKQQLPPAAEPLEIENVEQFTSLIQSSTLPVLADFWAEWCGPCKMVAPELAKLASMEAGHVLVAKVNTEQLPDLAATYRISSLPTMILFNQGNAVGQISGARAANDLRQFIRSKVPLP